MKLDLRPAALDHLKKIIFEWPAHLDIVVLPHSDIRDLPSSLARELGDRSHPRAGELREPFNGLCGATFQVVRARSIARTRIRFNRLVGLS